MTEITGPTINTNDSDAILRQWVRKDGDTVRAGDVVAVLETTKASYELESPVDGVLATLAVEGRRYDFGVSIGRLFEDEQRWNAARLAQPPEAPAAAELVITAAARRLIDTHGITADQLKALGKKVLKESDILAIPGVSGDSSIALDPRQQAIARIVTQSRATIPDAFLLHKIDVTTALARLVAFQQRRQVMVGLSELLVWVVARLPGEFPYFFGALDSRLSFKPSTAGHIGVTLDLGRGLFVPVIRDAGRLSLSEVSDRLARFRMQALRNNFEAADLSGGDLSISLNMDDGTVFVQPIILPPQTCMLSLGAVLTEADRRVVHLGIAYDHRAINGFQASAFARAIAAQLNTSVVLDE